jgi:ParB family chromosome partitioning protein
VIVHGERRFQASKAAGLASIPAIVRDVPEERRLVQQLMENIVRDDLNAVDRALALRSLKQQLGDAPWEQVAEAVGIRRSRLFQLLGTEKLPESVRDDIRAGRLSEKQSRALQGLAPGCLEALREAMIDDDLSADEAMSIARELRGRKIGDNREAAVAAIRDFRAPAPAAPPSDELGGLLAAISAAASGGSPERAQLRRLADGLALPGFDADLLQAHTLGLVRTLARAPLAELRPGSPVFSTLVALYGALDAVLAGEA